MDLHLVFSKPILEPLTKALRIKDYTISGVDVTLEQFEIAAVAGKIEAEIAIVDAAIGVAHKQESIRLLKQIRVCLPELRLIVLIPEEDEDWCRTLGMYGIYDVYTTEHFAVEDVQAWIEVKKTIADVPLFGLERAERPEGYRDAKVESQSQFTKESKGVMQSIQAAVQRFAAKKGSHPEGEQAKQAVEETSSVNLSNEEATVADQEEVAVSSVKLAKPNMSHIPQPYTVAVGALAARSGNTHTAIQVAFETAQRFKTAFVEYQSNDRPSDIVSFASDFDGFKFHHQGIDFFPNRTTADVMEVYALDYEVIVLDLGMLVELTEGKPQFNTTAQEFLRSQIQLLTLSAAPWDLKRLVSHLQDMQMLMKRASLVINYADDEMFRECKELLSPSSSSMIQNALIANPFTREGHLSFWLDQEQKEKKKRWFTH
ncbi:hypothetical protein ASL14_19020 [Paenibacillus sp. IHB B 3084]|uniref:hypothetical protein n=1 Tax=Paenibacillus sp. IHB B 3084 TaxID=867076 RepID=UPI000721FA28|nr:hypothetical protein [Paenibacillus sp. IHB B 3084]ALP37965.1 hypothetical protein ASL14_19020 [Paenibacillus sp. IHB B 3084]